MEELIDWIRNRPYYEGQIVDQTRLPARSASTQSVPLEHAVESALSARGITELYDHQVAALEAVRDGKNVVCATPTASGKSLTYTIPAFEDALTSDDRLLYIAPLRALINNQADAMRSLAADLPAGFDVDIAVYTGQTPTEDRQEVRCRKPDVILTTPDMLHLSFLPYAGTSWGWLFRSLSYVAVDEVHEFRGVFGSHVSMVFRRLLRICREYNADPQFICCSATIGNPVEHAAAVTGQDSSSFKLVDDDTSATGPQHWLLWNPPLQEGEPDNEPMNLSETPLFDFYDDSDSEIQTTTTKDGRPVGDPSSDQDPANHGGSRLSNHPQTIRLFCDLLVKGYQTLVFTTARQGAEQYVQWADRRLRSMGNDDLADHIVAYHGELPDRTRTTIETQLNNGTIRGVWSTNALELGIDIGTLDAVLLDGYPGTVMSTFQRAGRAGRGNKSSLITLIASSDPLDQHFMRNPAALFDATPEHATVNPDNEQLLTQHLRCAAEERPLTTADETIFGPELNDHIATLEEQDILERELGDDGIAWHHTDHSVNSPQYATTIRTIDDDEIELVDTTRDTTVTWLNFEAAIRDAYPQAIYTQQKKTYRVTDVDYTEETANLQEVQTTGYTKPLREKEITVHETYESKQITPNQQSDACPQQKSSDVFGVTVSFAEMTVSEQINGYLEFDSPRDQTGSKQIYDDGERPPERTIKTNGIAISVPPALERSLVAATSGDSALVHGLHAVEHVLAALFPLKMLCARHDIGGLSTGYHPYTGQPTIFLHDTHSGGVGLTQVGYQRLESLFQEAHETIADCPCTSGCPECIHSPHCGVRNADLDKELAEQFLRRLT